MTPDQPAQTSSEPSLPKLADLLTKIATGECPVESAIPQVLELLGTHSSESSTTTTNRSEHLTLDFDRQRRCGFPEVIYGEGKPASLIADIMKQQQTAGQHALATRVSPEQADEVLERLGGPACGIHYHPLARTLRWMCSLEDQPAGGEEEILHRPHVALITAGSTDAPVAAEALETLRWMQVDVVEYHDIGVAGPQRLLSAVPNLRKARTAIVIAGMEGALPAAVGGHLSVPVFAVPTSVGYGATLGGLTPLLGMLSSCASNVAVVNVDAGFKAGYLAGLVVAPWQNKQPQKGDSKDE
ncbi:AIR carboxylase [Stieleria bergensis]|uniref:AIR carboxylase n=1 Tax=Stieleria bergensis TaxID=2528025 RepID=A0A517SQP2_9BACT|nr:AIR carboxylase [Planctomycetes bacterium SV_7m_r]